VENSKNFKEILIGLNRYKTRMLLVALVLVIASVSVSFGLSPVYQSKAIILIEQQEIPQELVRSTVTSFVDQRIQLISQRVMTRANLTGIIKKYDLYADDRKTEPMEVIVEMIREDINMNTISADVVDPRSGRPTQATIAFELSYNNESPGLAQKVTNELVTLFLNENIKNRTRLVTETSGFLTIETDKLSLKIASLEKKLATFKEINMGQLPELVDLNMRLLDRTEQEMQEIDRRVGVLAERKIYLESELAQLNPLTAVYSDSGEKIMRPEDRLKVFELQLLSLSAVYGKSHPNLVRLKKQILALNNEKEISNTIDDLKTGLKDLNVKLLTAQKKYSDKHPYVKKIKRELLSIKTDIDKKMKLVIPDDEIPDNPAYIQLKAQLEAADAESDSLLNKKLELAKKLILHEDRITKTPQVERDLRALTRDYENTWTRYLDLKTRQMEANLSLSLESERKGERFTLIEPPQLPEEPVKPNRMAILALGMVASLAGGFGSGIMGVNMDDTVRGKRGFTSLVNIALIGTIPSIMTDFDKRRIMRRKYLIIASLCLILLLIFMSVHYLYMPLDVIWYFMLRRLGV